MWQTLLTGLMMAEQTIANAEKRQELEQAIVDAARFALKLTPATTILGKIATKIDELGKAEGL